MRKGDWIFTVFLSNHCLSVCLKPARQRKCYLCPAGVVDISIGYNRHGSGLTVTIGSVWTQLFTILLSNNGLSVCFLVEVIYMTCIYYIYIADNLHAVLSCPNKKHSYFNLSCVLICCLNVGSHLCFWIEMRCKRYTLFYFILFYFNPLRDIRTALPG